MFRLQSIAASAILASLAACGPGSFSACAQNDHVGSAPPNILVIQREFTKPGREGAAHEKTESAFIEALKASHSKTRYFALTALSGPGRTLFFNAYDSLADWEQSHKADMANADLTAALDQANQADGEMLMSSEQSVWAYRPEMSMNPGGLKGVRYMAITSLRIKPGHRQEFEQLHKMLAEGYKKADPNRNWAVFEEMYGSPGGGVLIITTSKTGADMDERHANGKKFPQAMGPDGLQKFGALESSCVTSVETNLFAINPKMSYPPDSWAADDPFWKQGGAEGAGTQ